MKVGKGLRLLNYLLLLIFSVIILLYMVIRCRWLSAVTATANHNDVCVVIMISHLVIIIMCVVSNIITTLQQTSQVSRFDRETHGFRGILTVSR